MHVYLWNRDKNYDFEFLREELKNALGKISYNDVMINPLAITLDVPIISEEDENWKGTYNKIIETIVDNTEDAIFNKRLNGHYNFISISKVGESEYFYKYLIEMHFTRKPHNECHRKYDILNKAVSESFKDYWY